MGSKKGELEIVCNLLWKDGSFNSDDRSNIVGMYDTPSTTLNWDTFKAYLLKNSGCSSEDVNVFYYDNEDKEIQIKSQEDFYLALYAFRKRARIGEIITLKLEKVKKQNSKTMHGHTFRLMADLEVKKDAPPDWFLKYMKKFKKEMVEEVATAVLNAKISSSSHHSSHHTRKSKVDGYFKRSRKLPLSIGKNFMDEVTKQSAVETAERRLERVELKAKKPKLKKPLLKMSSDSDIGCACTTSRPIGLSPRVVELVMNASNVHSSDAPILHMLGGERYLQQWEVLNDGKFPWTEATELRYAWGSQTLNPVNKVVSAPKLEPGQKGTVFVYLEIPEKPGYYECYWHFHHMGTRFGQWLGFQVIVDEPPMKTKASTLSNGAPNYKKMKVDDTLASEPVFNNLDETKYQVDTLQNLVTGQLQELKLEEIADEVEEDIPAAPKSLLLTSSDSDNISILSLSGSNSASSDYFMVHKDDANEQANNNLMQEECAQKNDVPVEDIKVEENEESEYAYIYFKGEKYPFHKKFLSDEYFHTAEKVNCQKETTSHSAPPILESEVKFEEQSAEPLSAGSSGRLFVFPQHSPGFEVVYPSGDQVDFKSNPEEYESIQSFNSCTMGCVHPVQPNFENEILQETEPAQTASSYTCCNSNSHYCGPLPHFTESTHGQCSSDNERERSFSEHDRSMNQSWCGYIHADGSNHSTEAPPVSVPQQPPPPPPKENIGFEQPRQHTTNSRSNQFSSENIITGAAILASSAMSTARSVMHMVMQNGNGKWVRGHWVADNPHTKRESNLHILAEMGFENRDLNATLLARYNDDVHRVISELVS